MPDSFLADLLSETALPWSVLLGRLTGAVVLCGLIGLEREARDRPAGLRTHMLVGLAAAVYCLLMIEIVDDAGVYADRVAMDPLRLLSSVTSGVAFLAAGMIVFSRGKVRGLTTGASLWLAAAIGVAAGLGMWLIAALGAFLALVIMRFVKIAEEATRGDEQDPGS
jgi:putative Mg2+ transporter-C (MgtC) family protein